MVFFFNTANMNPDAILNLVTSLLGAPRPQTYKCTRAQANCKNLPKQPKKQKQIAH